VFKLILLCDYTREPERRLLRGLTDYANQQGGWSYFQIPVAIYKDANRKMEVVERAREIKADAIFGRWEGVNKSIADSLGIPVVLRAGSKDYKDFPMLSGEYKEIGQIAANFFLRQHYDHFAFLGYRNLLWSKGRFDGYREKLLGHGVSFDSLEVNLSNPDEKKAIAWMKKLPKPVALFAVNDVLASRAAEWCQESGIRVPEDLALLGVDNDEFLCNIACPKISSINLRFEKQGFELGAALYKMRCEGKTSPLRIMVTPEKIVERESTLKHNIKDPYIKRIVDFIDKHFNTPITLEDIVRNIPLSRRAIEIRFKKEMAPETILSYLYRLRVKEMCNLLTFSDLPVGVIAEKSGFTDIENVGRTFKRYTGLSPIRFRKKKREESRPADNEYSGNKEG